MTELKLNLKIEAMNWGLQKCIRDITIHEQTIKQKIAMQKMAIKQKRHRTQMTLTNAKGVAG